MQAGRFSHLAVFCVMVVSGVLLIDAQPAGADVFAWDFEGAPTNGPAQNISSDGAADIIYNNGATTTSSTAAFGNDSLSIGAHPLSRGRIDTNVLNSATTQMSISVWVNAATADNNDGIVDRTPDASPTSDSQFRLAFFGTNEFRPQLFLRNSGSLNQNIAGSGSGGVANQWNHYVVVFDGTQADPADRVQMWVNNAAVSVGNFGAAVPTSIAAAPTNDGQWRLGIKIDGSGPLNSSFLDDVLITDSALTASDVNTLFTKGAAVFLVPEPASMGLLILGGGVALLRRRA